MNLADSVNYITNIDWFSDVLHNLDVILCHTSALECLGLFGGYLYENQINVYTKVPLPYDNVKCFIVSDFKNIDTITRFGLRYTSINQTINDMLRNFDIIDEQSLVQGLSDYYYMNGESFDNLKIDPLYIETFNSIKDWAIEYYKY